MLHDLGVRSGVDDLKALAAILIQADRFGSSIAQALRVQSDTMRIKRSQLAEEKAAKTAVQMIFPLCCSSSRGFSWSSWDRRRSR